MSSVAARGGTTSRATPPANQGELRRGRRLHVSYDLLVRGVQALGVIAVLLLIGGVFLAALYFLQMAAGAG
ncbi:MAG: hypothetical protein M5R40_23155 [Anaerolineae bacterium]|nr:hypothetical protein [Anaerolineae bacterium]